MPPKRILSVSYEQALLMRRELLLKDAGYAVTSALGQVEAQLLCRSTSFDLIIIGHAMPARDKQLLARLSHASCSAPVLVLIRRGEKPCEEADTVIEAADPDAALLDAIRRLLG